MTKPFSLFTFMIGLFALLSSNHRIEAGNWQRKSNPEFSKIIADFEKQLGKDLERDNTGSISAIIFRGDDIVWQKVIGKSNNEKNILADSTTVYRIGSISKSITAYLMMLMVQKGIIRLDEPVATYLPEIKQLREDKKSAGIDITFRQLADHTSGLEKEPDDFDNATLGRAEDWEKMLLEAIPLTRFHFPIGQQYWYSNIGYAILGMAISRAAHKPFIELVNEMIFQAHGMKNSFYIIPAGYENRVASGYHWYQNSETYSTEFADLQFVGRNYKVPPGGVFTTAVDLARFAIGLTADSDIVSKKYRDTMQTIQTSVGKGNDEGYGFGLFVQDDKRGIKKVRHDGQIAGFISFMVFNPETRIGVILLRNCDKPSILLNAEGNILLTKLGEGSKEITEQLNKYLLLAGKKYLPLLFAAALTSGPSQLLFCF